eukprot:6702712-Alexandrium_andersonii.AAC.1
MTSSAQQRNCAPPRMSPKSRAQTATQGGEVRKTCPTRFRGSPWMAGFGRYLLDALCTDSRRESVSFTASQRC